MTLMSFQRATPSAVRNLIELRLLLSLRRGVVELVTLTRVEQRGRMWNEWLLLIQDRRHNRLRWTRLHCGKLLELRSTHRLRNERLLLRTTRLVTLTPVGLSTDRLRNERLLLLDLMRGAQWGSVTPS
jgi:hypothetical protein